MPSCATHEPTLASELFGGGVGFPLRSFVRRSSGTLLIGLALLLPVRRAAGALDTPPSFGTALLVMGAVTVLAVAYRRTPPRPPWSDRDTALPIRLQMQIAYGNFAASLLPLAASILIAAALSLPGIGALPLLVLWGAIVAGEAAWLILRRRETIAAIEDSEPDVATKSVPATAAQVPHAEAVVETHDDVALAGDGLSQSWRRFIDESGADVFEGHVRVKFETGSKQAAIHLSFCPPFERTPTLEAEPLEELELRLVNAVVLPYAARIDVRLSEPAEEGLRTTVGIRAVAPPAGESKAESGDAGL